MDAESEDACPLELPVRWYLMAISLSVSVRASRSRDSSSTAHTHSWNGIWKPGEEAPFLSFCAPFAPEVKGVQWGTRSTDKQ